METELKTEQEIPSGIITSINFNILNRLLTEEVSVRKISTSKELTSAELGLPNFDSECRTCNPKEKDQCEGHFGHIDLPFTILHPCFLPEVAQILNKICPGCRSVRSDKVKDVESTSEQSQPSSCRYCDVNWRDVYPRMKFRVSSKELHDKTAIIAEAKENLSVRAQNRGGMAKDYWNIIPVDSQQDDRSLMTNTRVLSHMQVHHMLKEVDPKVTQNLVPEMSSMFINNFPVTPNRLRATEFGQHLIFQSSRRTYQQLINFKGNANELSTRVVSCLKMSRICSQKGSSKLTIGGDHAPQTSGLNFLKENLLGKRSDHSMRAVVIGDPKIELTEIGIPCYIADKMEITEYVNSYNKEKLKFSFELSILLHGSVSVIRNGSLLHLGKKKDDKLRVGDVLYRPLVDGDIVLTNRPPSIHQHSLIALKVKVFPVKSVVSVNPLICTPLRGDFDGDCLHVFIPQSVQSRVELRELVSLENQLIDGQSGRNLLSVNQDSLTAAYLIVQDNVILDHFQMQQLQMFCPAMTEELSAVVKATKTSSGKQLFSMLLPAEFSYESPLDGVSVRNGELISSSGGSSWLSNSDDNLFNNLMKHDSNGFLNSLQKIQETLCEWLSMRGFSVSLSDLYLAKDSYSRNHLIEEVAIGVRDAERISQVKLLMMESSEDLLMAESDEREPQQTDRNFDFNRQKLSISAFKQEFKVIEKMFYQYATNNNSFLAMSNSGSKGNLHKAVQHSMCLGLHNSVQPLPFKLSKQLSCDGWNEQKSSNSTVESGPYTSYSVIENSFLTGLNPYESFVHSLMTRCNSFSGQADISGTLNRRLMFFMRDLYVGYDGTVRNPYGNQVVQFSYYNNDDTCGSHEEENGLNPVGSLAACALSELAYSALDLPSTAVESSPLLNLKKVLECGAKKSSGDKTASLFLSSNLKRWIYGHEYGALEIQNRLERVLFSEILSTVMIVYTPQAEAPWKFGPWVCHFYIRKEISERKRVSVKSVIQALNAKCHSARRKSNTDIPELHIATIKSEVQRKNSMKFCLTVAMVTSDTNSSEQLDTMRDTVIPFLLGVVIKGSLNVKKVDILWKDYPNESRTHQSDGELYLRIYMSESCKRNKFWSVVKDDCLNVMELIDWQKSHPDDISDISSKYGIDVSWGVFLNRLKSAVEDTGKTVLKEHLVLATDSLSYTGEFVGLSAKGLGDQRRHTSVSSPFMRACFSNPSDCFIKAAKAEVDDTLQGCLESLLWGKLPSIGTGGHFDILFSNKDLELDTHQNVYSFINNTKITGDKVSPKKSEKTKRYKKKLKAIRRKFSSNDIYKQFRQLRSILHKYEIKHELTESDMKIVMGALNFHPQKKAKIGDGTAGIKVDYHAKFKDSRCFMIIRNDGTVEDFSYRKCMVQAMRMINPNKAKIFESKWLTQKDNDSENS